MNGIDIVNNVPANASIEVQDLVAMIKADTQHLAEALKNGNRVHAHGFVDAIIDNCRELEDINNAQF